MPLSLQNKKIIISAGASGIGWETAKICLSKGATVFVCDIDTKSIKKITQTSIAVLTIVLVTFSVLEKDVDKEMDRFTDKFYCVESIE